MRLVSELMFDVEDKTVLVVGGRGRLGRSFCSALAKSGAKVISADLPDQTTSAEEAEHANIEQKDVDVRDESSIKALVEGMVQQYEGIDVLIYSVTTKTDDSYQAYTDVSIDGWRKIINIELDGLFLLTQEVGRVMERQRAGAMIFISSIYGLVGNDHRIYQNSNLGDVYNPDGKESSRICSPAVYNVVKAGVISLSRYLAAYWGEVGIRVNCISPGGIAHPSENDEFVKQYSNRVPLARKARLDEIDGAVLYLASDSSSYVTGHNLVVDGGWTIW